MARLSKAEYWLTEEGLKLITHWKRNDVDEQDIAKKIGIAPSTFSEWKGRYPEIAEALKSGLEVCISDAEEALISKFKPYEVKETTVETWEDDIPIGKTGKTKKVKKTHKRVTNKTIMPDTTAIIFFLKAKAGWRENSETQDNEALNKLDAILNERRRNAFKQEAE